MGTTTKKRHKAIVSQAECVACGCCVKLCPLMDQENETMLCRMLEARHFQRDIDFTVSWFSAAGLLLDTKAEIPVSRTYQREIAERFTAFVK